MNERMCQTTVKKITLDITRIEIRHFMGPGGLFIDMSLDDRFLNFPNFRQRY